MIDFRYHIVSLMAVLIALTVGVVLGAGPLQGPLSATLTGQLEQLKESQNASRTEIESLRAQVEQRDSTIKSVADQVLPGTLADRKVALVTFPSANSDAVAGIKKYLEEGNAKVVAEVSLTNDFLNVAKAAYRAELSKRVPENLGGQASASASNEQLLFAALVKVLTDNSAESSTLKSYLTSNESALVKLPENYELANSVVVVGNPAVDQKAAVDSDKDKDPATEISNDAVLGVARALSELKIPNVMVGSAASTADNISIVRSENMKLATVDSLGRTSAAFSVALVLGEKEGSDKTAYGFETGAGKPLPPLPKAK